MATSLGASMNEYSVKFIDKLALLKILFNEVPLIHLLFELINSR